MSIWEYLDLKKKKTVGIVAKVKNASFQETWIANLTVPLY